MILKTFSLRDKLVTALTLQFLSACIVIPQVIPEVEIVEIILFSGFYLAGFLVTIIFIKDYIKLLKQKQEKSKNKINALKMTGLTLGFIGWFFILFIWGVFQSGQGFMGGKLEKKFVSANGKTTLYLYDEGFLNFVSSVKVRDSGLPFMKDLDIIYGQAPQNFVISEEGDSLIIQNGKEKRVYHPSSGEYTTP